LVLHVGELIVLLAAAFMKSGAVPAERACRGGRAGHANRGQRSSIGGADGIGGAGGAERAQQHRVRTCDSGRCLHPSRAALVDALFGTLYLPATRWPAHYGIDDTEPTGYLRQLAWPLRSRCASDADAERPKLFGQQTLAPNSRVCEFDRSSSMCVGGELSIGIQGGHQRGCEGLSPQPSMCVGGTPNSGSPGGGLPGLMM
jgi:hypothetical protein